MRICSVDQPDIDAKIHTNPIIETRIGTFGKKYRHFTCRDCGKTWNKNYDKTTDARRNH